MMNISAATGTAADACQSNETNPLNLTVGLRYHIHGTEPFDATAMPKMSRRSTSMGVNSLLLQDASPVQPTRLRSLTVNNAPAAEPSTKAELKPLTETPSALSTSIRETAPLSLSPTGVLEKPDGYFPPIAIPQPASRSDHTTPTGTVPPPVPGPYLTDPPARPQATEKSPIDEESSLAEAAPMALPVRSSHHRTPSRALASPTMREAAVFAPSSLGRPASVASSHSSHPRGIPIGPTGGKSAPAMAITTSDGSGGHSPGDRGPFLDDRRRASGSSLTAEQREEVGSVGIGRSPLSNSSGSRAPSTVLTRGVQEAGDASGKATPRTISRGFSIGAFGKKRTASNASTAPLDKAQTAVDILKQYDDKK